MKWLPDMDLNHDKQIQSLLCYRYTIGQTRAGKVEFPSDESRTLERGSPPCRMNPAFRRVKMRPMGGWILEAVAAEVTRRNDPRPPRYLGGYSLQQQNA